CAGGRGYSLSDYW
nr:immunoglobulin heavy chain junction region [Macaca mulatta]MOV53604.1 immunoglobulin heavy chain junction region [Macaca mulatta]MOV53993.1 immunoglobulin heavy chain junction region [Macaca mulatta]MOV54008.1 immunoglobulin heavy chain junction region [Macaca mulatta]MOV54261.1 immunoglobulin heavy chain junction region [Macaca mulatta]